jgi:hypothetical protein
VGDEDHRSFIGVKRLSDNWEMSEIDMIGWLVEDKKSWLKKDKSRE